MMTTTKKKLGGALIAGAIAFTSFGATAMAAPKQDKDPHGTTGYCVTNHKEVYGGGAVGDARRGNGGAVSDQNRAVHEGDIECR